MVTPRRRAELEAIYAAAIEGVDQAAKHRAWMRLLVALYKEGNELEIFQVIRRPARNAGARVANEFLAGNINVRQFFNRVQAVCADRYATDLDFFRLARIDQGADKYKRIRRKAGFEVLQAFRGVDPSDKTAVCTAMANNWHRLVQLLHSAYRLPTVENLKTITTPESDAEQEVFDRSDYETKMTSQELSDWEAAVA